MRRCQLFIHRGNAIIRTKMDCPTKRPAPPRPFLQSKTIQTALDDALAAGKPCSDLRPPDGGLRLTKTARPLAERGGSHLLSAFILSCMQSVSMRMAARKSCY